MAKRKTTPKTMVRPPQIRKRVRHAAIDVSALPMPYMINAPRMLATPCIDTQHLYERLVPAGIDKW
jgi:hypothetical protein